MAFDHRHLRLTIPPLLLTLAALPLGWSLWAAVQAGLDAAGWTALLNDPQTLPALAMSLWTGLLASALSTAAAAWLLCRTFSALPDATVSTRLARGLALLVTHDLADVADPAQLTHLPPAP
jgi:putative thiamine transport system permease protein